MGPCRGEENVLFDESRATSLRRGFFVVQRFGECG